MAERDKSGTKIGIGSGGVRANFPNSPACGQWETLLVDALDGLLQPEDEATFSGHMASCTACAEMFEQVRRGREWLEFLAPEPEVPSHLLDRILLETGQGKADAGRLIVAGGAGTLAGNVVMMPQPWQRPGFKAGLRRFAEPRLLMTAAMAFFSIALTLSLTGVRISGVKLSDLRPAALRSAVERRIMTASTPIVRYYDHLRFVYEVESRMKELRRSSETAQPSQQKDKPNGNQGETQKKDGGSKLNPNEAPQQTVNPPSSLWSGEVLEARFEPKPGLQARKNRFNTTDRFNRTEDTMGSPTLTQISGVLEVDLDETGLPSVLAMPERSNSCLA
jgi:hypothetical protein